MHISNMKINSYGMVEIFIPDGIESTLQPCLCERIEQGIWAIHFRKIPLDLVDKDVFCFDAKKLHNTFEYDKEKIFDLFLVDNNTQRETPIDISLEKDFVDAFSQISKTECGEITCRYYKNANNRLSVRATFTSLFDFRANVKEIKNDALELTLSSDCTRHIDWFFARKTTMDNTLRFDKLFSINVGFDVANSKIVLNKRGLLSTLSQGGGETWVLVANVDGIYFRVLPHNDIESDVFDINDAVTAKIKSKKDEIVQIETLENSNEAQPKLRVAVMGSCFARQAFNSKDFFNPDYKRFYECKLTAYHFSLPSILSSPIAVKQSDLVGAYQSDLNVHGKAHFDKDFLDRLKEYHPDYLIFENYVHISAPLIETKEHSYIDENYYLVDTPAFKDLNVSRRILAETEEHFEIYKRYLLRFKEAVREILPFENIVLVRAQPALKKNENGTLSEWDTSQQIKYRRHIWERYDSYFISQIPQARIIDMRDEKYVSEKSPYLKFAPSHFGSAYYKDVLYHFNKITLQDLIKEHGKKQ